MIDSKRVSRILIIAVCMAMVLTAALVYFKYSFGGSTKKTMAYESTLFDTSYVHNIDIVIDSADWEDMLQNANAEEYHVCDAVIDGKSFQNVAIRTKGNSSLSSVSQMDSDRYSFKIEFDHYSSGKSCYGLDKLSLNNIISDSTYMKDYLCYTLMREAGAVAPLSSFISVKINGEDFGLYLAVEGVEEAFCERNFYGSDGKLYKPDSMDINDKVADFDPTKLTSFINDFSKDGGMQPPEFPNGIALSSKTDAQPPDFANNGGGMGGEGKNGGGMGSSGDVALQYIDDNISSYENIFNNAVFDVTDADKKRLIASIKQLNEGTQLDSVVDIDEVLSYFVVQTFVCNGDGYTGSLVHNYYLYEDNGLMSMIAWDYNLAFGGMEGGGFSSGENSVDQSTKCVNAPIDTPVTSGNMSDRPMINSLLSNEKYLERYHELYSEFISNLFESNRIDELIDATRSMISDYVKNDKTAFYTYDEFSTAVDTLKAFCSLRAQSIRGQLDGTYPIMSSEQTYESGTYVDASAISIGDMGGQNMGGGHGDDRGGNGRDTDAGMPQMFQTDGKQPPGFASMSDAVRPGGQGHMGQGSDMSTGGTRQNSEWLYYLLGAIVLLAAGLIFVKCFKRKTW